jgi:hypothetical protein
MKTTRITIETETLTIVHRAQIASAWCPECCTEERVITLDAASLEDPGNAAEIERWRRTGKLHRWRQAGSTLLCLKSLFECFDCEQPKTIGNKKKV